MSTSVDNEPTGRVGTNTNANSIGPVVVRIVSFVFLEGSAFK